MYLSAPFWVLFLAALPAFLASFFVIFVEFYRTPFPPLLHQVILPVFSAATFAAVFATFVPPFPMAIRVSRTTPDPTLLLVVVAASEFVKEFCPFARVIHLRIHQEGIYCSSIMMLSVCNPNPDGSDLRCH